MLYGAAVLALAALSCSDSSSSCCDEACQIWDDCMFPTYPYEVCIEECTAAGDWCDSYIECIRGKSCQELDQCE
jgi:hypothetical protein